MKFELLLFGLALSIFSTSYSFGQKDCSYRIDTIKILLNENLDTFLVGLKNNEITRCNNKESIPIFIRDQLDCLTGGFSIANPGQDYRCCCTSSTELPKRQLLFMAKSRNMLIMTYLTGGFGVSTHMLFIKFSNNKIIDLWTGVCLAELKSKKQILEYIKKNRYKEWGINTNFISL